MAQGIVDGLLHDTVNRCGQGVVKAFQHAAGAKRQAHVGVINPPVAQQVLQRIVQAKTVQSQRAQLGDQPVHAVVDLVGTFHHQMPRTLNQRITPRRPAHNGQTSAFDGGDLLTQFIVQLACNGTALLLDARLDELCELAVLGQGLGSCARLLPGQRRLLHRLGHGIESVADLPPFTPRQGRQPRVVSALLHALQAVHHLP